VQTASDKRRKDERVLQVIAALSLFGGGLYGRIFGIGAAALSSIGALLSILAYPFWSLAIFALDRDAGHRGQRRNVAC
jgi:hypothetical protein